MHVEDAAFPVGNFLSRLVEDLEIVVGECPSHAGGPLAHLLRGDERVDAGFRGSVVLVEAVTEAVEKGQLVFGEEGSRAADDGAQAREVEPGDDLFRNLEQARDHRRDEMDRGHLVLIHQLEKTDRIEARLIDRRPSEDEVHQVEEGGCGVIQRAADEMHLVRAHLQEADGLHHVLDDLGPGGEVGAARGALGLSRGPGCVDHGAARSLASRQALEVHLGWVVEEVLVVSGSLR